MRNILITLLCFLLLPANALADEVSESFTTVQDIGPRSKPTIKISSAREAMDFILADELVRDTITSKITEGYEDFEATAKLMGYDVDEPVYAVRIISSTLLPPFACVFRFDSIGNDRREKPWAGCQYE